MKNKSRDKIVIFESIKLALTPIIFLYLINNYKVYYFNVDSRINKKNWFQKKIQQGKLEGIKWEKYDVEFYYRSHDIAFEKIEDIYGKRFQNSGMINVIERLFKSKLIHEAYKKILIENLQYAFDLQSMLNDFINKNKYKKSIFFPIKYLEIISKKDRDLDSKIKIAPLSYLIFYIKTAIKKMGYFAHITLMPMWIIIHIEKIFPNKIDQKKYQVGIRIYGTDSGAYGFYRLRSVDFLLDGEKINKNNTLFCIETKISDEYMQNLKEKKYNTVELPEILSKVDKNFMKETLNMGYLFVCFKVAILSCLEPLFFAKSSLKVLYEYLVWKCFLVKYHIKNYVVYNDFAASHITRNILLNQNDIKTWYYGHSCNYPDTYAPPDTKTSMRHVVLAFLYYDYLISWGNKPMRYLRGHPSHIKQYMNLGALWSEHVRMISEGELQSNIAKDLQKKMKKSPIKIISVFDTTFGQSVPLQSNDMFLFIEGILKLLDDHPEIGVIFKEKWPWGEFLERNPEKEIISIYEELKSHERCYTVGNTFETAEAIAVSDLVTSACFTSCTIEALGARKKAIYFDASDKLRDYYYDKFPKLVAHGYNELKKLVRYWLYDITDEEFEKYLETYVKGELDAYVDGRAITRFRELLIQ